MQSIIECDHCGYSRSSDEDGQMFHEVCAICYQESCPTPVAEVLICDDCNKDDSIKQGLIDPGESLLT